MNPEPQPAEFDPSEELTRFHDADQEIYGLSERVFFYLLMSCRAVESFAESAFIIEGVLDLKTKAPSGCCVDFVVRGHAFRIDTHERVKLWASVADEADSDSRRYLVFVGDSANPSSWEGLLKAIGRVEHFGVLMNHADRLRQMWTQWLAEQKRRGDERGW